MANGNEYAGFEMTELDWLIVGEFCKDIIGPRHEIDRSRYQDPNEEIEMMIQDKIDRREKL
jgi:hypothetical protein